MDEVIVKVLEVTLIFNNFNDLLTIPVLCCTCAIVILSEVSTRLPPDDIDVVTSKFPYIINRNIVFPFILDILNEVTLAEEFISENV